MGLESILSVVSFSKVRSRPMFRTASSLVDKIKNTYRSLSYDLKTTYTKAKDFTKKYFIDTALKYTGLKYGLEKAATFFFEARLVGCVPQRVQDWYIKKFNIRPKNRPTRNSVIWGFFDSAFEFTAGSAIGATIPFIGPIAGGFLKFWAIYGVFETLARGAYTFTTKKNIGIVTYKLPELGIRGVYNTVRKKKPRRTIPMFRTYTPASVYA